MQHEFDSDQTLVLLTLAGDQEAYERLVLRYEKTVIAAARRVTHLTHLAEDAAQDAFVTAWMKLNTLKNPARFGPWVCIIAKNCVKNMVMRCRSYLPLDHVEQSTWTSDEADDPARLTERRAEASELDAGLKALSDRVQKVIRLHYFEDLSVREIAVRLGIAEGTVKWQLHEGRRKIRKELCAMNEGYYDTLVMRVMKKVEELKLWQLRGSKEGFEEVYRDVLAQVEELEDSKPKSSALADVLMRGWWWIEGAQNDELLQRIKAAAMEGHNEEVMTFVAHRECYGQPWGELRNAFLQDVEIPWLTEHGFSIAAAVMTYHLATGLYSSGKKEEGKVKCEEAIMALPADHIMRYIAMGEKEIQDKQGTKGYEARHSYCQSCHVSELRRMEGKLCHFGTEMTGDGSLNSRDRLAEHMLEAMSRVDGLLFDPTFAVGQTYTASDGSTLTLEAIDAAVQTPSGSYENCAVWKSHACQEDEGWMTCRVWLKKGVGIVRFEHVMDGYATVRLLVRSRIVGGEGYLPLAMGNSWEYEGAPSEYLREKTVLTVTYTDGDRTLISNRSESHRTGYDPDSWLDAVQEMRNEYYLWDDVRDERVQDVSPAIKRAQALASTKAERVHAKVAGEVMERILATYPGITPDCTTHGYWNFFQKHFVCPDPHRIRLGHSFRWSFELKGGPDMGEAEGPLYQNDLLCILQDATRAIWSDSWRIGASMQVEYTHYGDTKVKTEIRCVDGGTVTVKGGCFENCLTLILDTVGFTEGLAYRAGHREYTFAPGIGIVRAVFGDDTAPFKTVYELAEFIGEGEGYQPIRDGLYRRYEALNLTDGFEAGVSYTHVADEDGHVAIFSDQKGIRHLPPPITTYGSIQGEMVEERLWDEGKLEESRLIHDLQNFRLLTHFLGRPNRNWAAPEKAVAWSKYRMKVMESLSPDGEIPDAWKGHYASTAFRTACALFGMGKKEEGYEYLERAFDLYPKWETIENGSEMEVGDPMIWGGIKVIKGKKRLLLPDGRQEVLHESHLFEGDASLMYYGMTAPRGWEWFNPVRAEERFKEYVARAAEMKHKN